MSITAYAYRRLSDNRQEIEERLEEALARGWELHTFCPATEDGYPSAVFKQVRGAQPFVFADDDKEAE